MIARLYLDRMLPMPLWRNGGLRVLMLAILVAVAALTAVGAFAARVASALNLQGAAVLAADLVVEQGRSIPTTWLQEATRRELAAARLVTFPSVLVHHDRSELVQVKAVDTAYPLRGRLRVQTRQGEVFTAPPAGQAWVVQKLADRLHLQLGDEIGFGYTRLRVGGILLDEPDAAGNLFRLAPRLMVNRADLAGSRLLGPASRVRERLLLAGATPAVRDMADWLRPQLGGDADLLDLDNARPELRSALERGRRFLSLAALCAALLAGVGIMLATRRYVARALDGAAVMRALGMRARRVLVLHLLELGAAAVYAGLIGALCGYAAQSGLVALVAEWFGEPLPLPGWRPAWLGISAGLLLAAGFALPTLLRIARVPPMRVLRRELDPPGLAAWLTWGLAALSLGLLMWWQVGEFRLAAWMAGVMSLSVAMLSLLGGLALRLLARGGYRGGIGLGLAALRAQPGLSLLQLVGFGLGITLVLLLSLVRIDLLAAWQGSLPARAPNHFLINIQPTEVSGLEAWLGARDLKGSGMYASTRARLTHIDGVPVQPAAYASDRARRLAAREFSLGFSARLQDDNRVLAGQWWDTQGAARPGFSVEQGLAEALQLKVGSALRFDVAGQPITASVDSIRSVNWDSFNVNFFVVGTPALLADLPVAYISSLYLDPQRGDLLRDLSAAYPAVSVIDLGPLLAQVRRIMDQGALAIEGVFLFTLLAAALISVAAIQVSRDQRAQEIAVLRTLGAGRRTIGVAVLTEFGVLGLLAGTIAAALAGLTGSLLAERLFDLVVAPNPLVWLAGMLGGTLLVATVGWLATRRLLATPPLRVLDH